MRILVTGGSGFIGTNLVEHFSSHDHELLNIDIASPRNSSHLPYWKFCDLLNFNDLCYLVHEFSPEIIFHMGARTDLNGLSVVDYQTNILGVKNLISAVEGMHSLKRLIFASSRLVCRIGYSPKDEFDYCPTTPYGESKVIGETLVREAFNQLPCPSIIVRPTSIWGPWFDIPYKSFFLAIARNHYVHPGRTHILKSFGYVGNTIYQLEKLMHAHASHVAGKTIYLADYPPIDITIMANTIQRTLNTKPIKTVSKAILRPAAWVGDIAKGLGWQNPPLTTFRLNNLLSSMVHDLEPLEQIVGKLPFTMEEGITETITWLRSQGNV